MSNVTNLLFLTKLICTVWARSLGQTQDENINFFQHGKQTDILSKWVHVFFAGALVVLINIIYFRDVLPGFQTWVDPVVNLRTITRKRKIDCMGGAGYV